MSNKLTKLANVYLSIVKTFAYTETIEVPVDFDEDDLTDLVQVRIHQVDKSLMVKKSVAYDRCFAEDTTLNDPESELSSLTTKPVLEAFKNPHGDVVVAKKIKRPDVRTTSVAVSQETLDKIKSDFFVTFNSDVLANEVIIKNDEWNEKEFSSHLETLLANEGVDVTELLEMSYIVFYLKD